MLLISFTARGAVGLGQIDTFEDGTTQGWGHGLDNSPVLPANIPTGGPGGAEDNYLLIRTTGTSFGPGSRMIALNTSQWTGDFLGAGIGAIELDARNYTTAANIVLRLAFRGPTNETFVTNGITLGPASDWTRLRFDISESNMAQASGIYSEAFSNVTMMRILHNPNPPINDHGQVVRNTSGQIIAAELGIDNITAIPEPSALAGWLLLAASAILARVRVRGLNVYTGLVHGAGIRVLAGKIEHFREKLSPAHALDRTTIRAKMLIDRGVEQPGSSSGS